MVNNTLESVQESQTGKSIPCYIKLRATNPALNLDRAYEILFQKGLFNSWLITTAYGRYGHKGVQTKTYSFDLEIQAQSFFNKTLKKRLNAKKRIGCNYEPI
jgi:predicted DNA-binding WGR domain protein